MEKLEFGQAFSFSNRFDHAWRSLKLAPLPLLVGALIMNCTEGGSGGNGGNHNWNNSESALNSALDRLDRVGVWGASVAEAAEAGPSWLASSLGTTPAKLFGTGLGAAVIAMIVVGVILVVLAFLALRCWVHPGFLRLQRQVLATGTGDFDTLFSGADLFKKMFVYKVIKALLVLGVVIVSVLPGGILAAVGGIMDNRVLLGAGIILAAIPFVVAMIYLSLGLTMGELAITFGGLDPTDALKRSWEIARGHRFDLFIFFLISFLLMIGAIIVGLLMCLIGVIVTVQAARAVYEVAFTEAFLLYTGADETSDEWAIWKTPEPGTVS